MISKKMLLYPNTITIQILKYFLLLDDEKSNGKTIVHGIVVLLKPPDPLQWRHNGRDGVSNNQPHDCLLNRLFRHKSKKTSKLRVTGLFAGNSPVTGEFPAQRAVTRKMFVFNDVIMLWLYNCKYRIEFIMPRYVMRSRTTVWSWSEKIQFEKVDMTFSHDDVIKWKHFPRNWPFVRGIHRSRWIPQTKASDTELWCFLWSASE